MKIDLSYLRRALFAALCAWSLAFMPVLNASLMAQQTGGKLKPRVAVLEFTGVGINEAEAAAVSDQMRTDLVNLRVFTVLDRSQTDKVIDELAFQQEGFTDPDQVAEIGRILNVEFIVTGRVTALEGAYQVNTQMIDVETAEIVRSENILYRGHILGLLSENIATIAARLAQVEPAMVPGPVPPGAQVEEEDDGWPWWVWVLIGVGALAAAGGGGGGDGGAAGGGVGGGSCGSCGSVLVGW